MDDVTTLDGRAFSKFVAAGTYFLRKYRQAIDDLNVFPVPDGDTGSNMYLTVRSALAEIAKTKPLSLCAAASAAATGSLIGARGNSGVILSQMLRGFAARVHDMTACDTQTFAAAMHDAVRAARAALLKPIEGTIISVATAAADAAGKLSQCECEFYRLGSGIVRAAAEALERTPDQLPVLKEAGVVDSGGAGFLYFIEGILRFTGGAKSHATAFPQHPARRSVFTQQQHVGLYRFCTEFILEDAQLETAALRELLSSHGDSLIVAGGVPQIKVHVHTDDAPGVCALAAEYGRVTRLKVENMEEQHNVLVVERPSVTGSIVAVVPGVGFERIARDLGASATVSTGGGRNPSVRDLLVACNACLADRVYLLANDPNVVLAASEVRALCDKEVVVVPTRDVAAGIAVQLALSGTWSEPPTSAMLMEAAGRVESAQVFFAAEDASVEGASVQSGQPAAEYKKALLGGENLTDLTSALVRRMGAENGGLLTLYYGGRQTEADARTLQEALLRTFEGLAIETYFGGQTSTEYVVSFER